nr:MAG TPA: hypothetical protein [Bacteriophage sp.]
MYSLYVHLATTVPLMYQYPYSVRIQEHDCNRIDKHPTYTNSTVQYRSTVTNVRYGVCNSWFGILYLKQYYYLTILL